MKWGVQDVGNGLIHAGERSAVHGLVGGGLQAAEGGNFQDGFLSAAVSEALPINALGDVNDDKSLPIATMIERAGAAAVVGGTVAAATGGNFANGAKTSAFAELFNDIADWCQNTYAASSQTGMTQMQYALCEAGLKQGEALAFVLAGFDMDVTPIGEYSPLIVQNGIMGRAAESMTLNELGLAKNTSKVFSGEGASIPDALTNNGMYEIKNVNYQSFTKQLRIQSSAAQNMGLKNYLYVDARTQISKTLYDAFDIRRINMR
jgi:hypothetical protein